MTGTGWEKWPECNCEVKCTLWSNNAYGGYQKYKYKYNANIKIVCLIGKHEWLPTIYFVFQSDISLSWIQSIYLMCDIRYDIMWFYKRVDDINMWAKQMHNHCTRSGIG